MVLVDGFIPQIFCVETLFNFDEGQEMLPFVGASHCPAYLPHFAAGFGLGGELIGTDGDGADAKEEREQKKFKIK